MNGDELRHVRFGGGDYEAAQVDDLLDRIAVELDAGRPVAPLITNATFRLGRSGYDIDAVDWFLEQLRRREDHSELARMSADPWRELAVVNYFTGNGPGDVSGHTATPSRQTRWKDWKYVAQECADAWRGFGQEPGTHLRWVRAGAVRRELRTAGQQTIASLRYGRPGTVSTGGKTFTWKRVTGSARPGIEEIIRRSFRGYGNAHFPDPDADTSRSRKRQAKARSQKPTRADRVDPKLRELLDVTGMPILYTSGRNYGLSARACITFPDQRRLRFPVRGTRQANAIMTAVDQAGNKVARYRIIGMLKGTSTPQFPGLWKAIEITVHPGQQLTGELAIAIAISAPWLSSYFTVPGGGGG